MLEKTASFERTVPNRTCAVCPDVVAIAQRRLAQLAYPALKRIDCRYHEGVLVVAGEVPSFYQKQLALQQLLDLPGVEELDIRLQVSQ